jgi:hypothetical protein
MENAFHPRTIPIWVFAIASLFPVPAGAKTLERINLSAGAGGTLSDPGIWIGKSLGYGFVFLGPGVDLFENRLSLQLDLGVSDAMFRSTTFGYDYSRYTPLRDTLFRTESEYTYRNDETQFTLSYTGALNFGSWSFYGGSMSLWTIVETERKGTDIRGYSTGDSLERFHESSRAPFKEHSMFGYGNVMALYGAARRFDRVTVFVQGVALVSIQAGVRVSLYPLGKVAPHRGP